MHSEICLLVVLVPTTLSVPSYSLFSVRQIAAEKLSGRSFGGGDTRHYLITGRQLERRAVDKVWQCSLTGALFPDIRGRFYPAEGSSNQFARSFKVEQLCCGVPQNNGLERFGIVALCPVCDISPVDEFAYCLNANSCEYHPNYIPMSFSFATVLKYAPGRVLHQLYDGKDELCLSTSPVEQICLSIRSKFELIRCKIGSKHAVIIT